MGVALLADATLVEAAKLLRDRTVSARALCDAVINRIAETEPELHAYVVINDADARVAASEVDERYAREESLPPLAGIPIAVKDVFATRDGETTAGCEALRGRVDRHDAAAVAGLRKVGAVIVGKTTTHELAYGQKAPPTRNAAHPDHLPGGSSAGSAVAVAAGSAVAALGTDGGGSVRHPAALNGVVGLKPTYNRLDRSGVVTGSPSLDHVGILARTADDCATVFRALSQDDELQAKNESLFRRTSLVARRPLDGIRIGLIRDLVDASAPDVQRDLSSVAGVFSNLGAGVVETTLPDVELALSVGMIITLVETTALNAWITREVPDQISVGTRVMLELGEFIAGADYVRALAGRQQFAQAVRRVFTKSQFDMLLTPTVPDVAPPVPDKERESMWEATDDELMKVLTFQMWANVAGMPAISIPAGHATSGLPTAFQLAGRPNADEQLLTTASIYEAATGGNLRRPFERPNLRPTRPTP
jgi:aspartyl-tRNA(Asn)/glutamyl-tRNA(Gln) amidotransferase subunit A